MGRRLGQHGRARRHPDSRGDRGRDDRPVLAQYSLRQPAGAAPPEEGLDATADDPEQTDLRYASLLGAIGVAATPLRPAGTVRLGDQYVDVVAEGSYVEAGSRIQVVEVEAHRIVVKEV